MQDDARERIELLRDLRQAVEDKQLELFYQPKIDARSGQVTAAEALLRWHHPTRGTVSPEVFIPIAERYGLIGAIGNWVIEDACRQAARVARTRAEDARRDQPVGVPDAPGRPGRAHPGRAEAPRRRTRRG